MITKKAGEKHMEERRVKSEEQRAESEEEEVVQESYDSHTIVK